MSPQPVALSPLLDRMCRHCRSFLLPSVGMQYRVLPPGAVALVDSRRLFQIVINGIRLVGRKRRHHRPRPRPARPPPCCCCRCPGLQLSLLLCVMAVAFFVVVVGGGGWVVVLVVLLLLFFPPPPFSNAGKFTERGTVRIDVILLDARYLCVTVTNPRRGEVRPRRLAHSAWVRMAAAWCFEPPPHPTRRPCAWRVSSCRQCAVECRAPLAAAAALLLVWSWSPAGQVIVNTELLFTPFKSQGDMHVPETGASVWFAALSLLRSIGYFESAPSSLSTGCPAATHALLQRRKPSPSRVFPVSSVPPPSPPALIPAPRSRAYRVLAAHKGPARVCGAGAGHLAAGPSGVRCRWRRLHHGAGDPGRRGGAHAVHHGAGSAPVPGTGPRRQRLAGSGGCESGGRGGLGTTACACEPVCVQGRGGDARCRTCSRRWEGGGALCWRCVSGRVPEEPRHLDTAPRAPHPRTWAGSNMLPPLTPLSASTVTRLPMRPGPVRTRGCSRVAFYIFLCCCFCVAFIFFLLLSQPAPASAADGSGGDGTPLKKCPSGAADICTNYWCVLEAPQVVLPAADAVTPTSDAGAWHTGRVLRLTEHARTCGRGGGVSGAGLAGGRGYAVGRMCRALTVCLCVHGPVSAHGPARMPTPDVSSLSPQTPHPTPPPPPHPPAPHRTTHPAAPPRHTVPHGAPRQAQHCPRLGPLAGGVRGRRSRQHPPGPAHAAAPGHPP
jgi:hypothetical protein